MRLKAYDFSCGAVEKIIINEKHLFITYGEIYKEHGIYHARIFTRVKNSSSVDRIAWESFTCLREARKFLKNHDIKKIA
jgi:hypothetical protein